MAGLTPMAEFPGGVPGGPIEQVKRAVIVALKEGLQGTTLGKNMSGTDVTVDMEYPMEAQSYPGIWVQFSFSEITNAGLAHEHVQKQTYTDKGVEKIRWEVIREIMFKGTISLTIVALTSLERDRLADSVVTMLAYARMPEYVLRDKKVDTNQFRDLATALKDNPYVAIAVNHDSVTPGGQTVTPGVPWNPEQPGYEDTFSFDIIGQSNMVFRNDGTYTLRAVTTDQEMIRENPFDPFEWN